MLSGILLGLPYTENFSRDFEIFMKPLIACGSILSDIFKKDYAQNMLDLQRVNTSIERQFK